MTPKQAYTLAKQGPITPELEAIIATSALYSYRYAKYILDEPFLLGEIIMATNANCSYNYAYHILKNPFQ